jgi:hypothetical protein
MKLKKEHHKPIKKTAQDKKVKQRFSKKDYVSLLSDAEKYPLAIRIAAELFRGGVSGRKFLDEFHLDGNSFSTQIHGHMAGFDLGRGIDPNKVPPVLPEFLRHIPTEKIKAEKLKSSKGRPTSEQAMAFVKKFVDDCLKRGWDETDLLHPFRELIDKEVVLDTKVKMDDDLAEDEPEKKAKTEKAYFARIGKKWERFQTQGDAVKAMEEDDDKVLGPVENPVAGEHCVYCKFRLNGTIVTVRTEKTVEHMHMGCYQMEVCHPAQLTVGMKALHAPSGIYYRYHGADKGGWKKEEPVNDETPVTSGASSEGVSAPSGAADNEAKAV